MQWFEMGYDRKNVADRIMQAGNAERVCEGYMRTAFLVKELGTMCHLHYYDQRKSYDPEEGSVVTKDEPLFVLQVKYLAPDGVPVDARLNIDEKHSVLMSSSEYGRLDVDRVTEEDPEAAEKLRKKIWDEAMAATDEAFCAHAQHLGNLLANVNMIPAPQEVAEPYLPHHTVAA